jgi:GTP-binding protein HflX
VSDTVGFVRKLPHELVEAFKSTLEEVARADLILHVADASALDVEEQVAAVREVLGEIGAGLIPEVLALNKWDRVDEAGRRRARRRFAEGEPISALTGAGLEALRSRIADALPPLGPQMTLLIPFDRPDVLASLHREAEVVRSAVEPEGTVVVAKVPPRHAAAVEEFVLARRGPATVARARRS